MNDHEKYLFDLRGYIAVENALSTEQLTALNQIMDRHIEADCTADMRTHRFGGLLDWGAAYRGLIANERVVPYVEQIIDPLFRLDHIYADIIRSGTSPIGANLHGGGTPFRPSQYYRFAEGRMHNGLTVVAYNLADVGPEDGGFGCVPGSHKSNYRFPGEWRDMDQALADCVERVTGPAGTAIIFTEALMHGALPWTGAGERRSLFYKYSPHPISWSASYFDADAYPDLSERERDILEAPNARYRDRPR